MKKIKIIAGIAAVAVVGAIVAVAQMSHKGGFFQHHQDFAKQHEQMFDHISEKLKLSDDQKTQAKQILADSKPRFQPLMEQLRETHRTTDLGVNGVFDERQAQELAARQAEIVKQLLVEKERTKAALFAVLTPDQREQAKQMLNDFVESFQH
jgi:Spy/CpxP family protein refolding chaperone